LYTMVTFSPDIRYSEAWLEGQRQESIMQKVMALPGIESQWDSAETEQFMLGQLTASS
jgi:kynurenine 3-monooxygenase